jgi:hypothetical protein
MIVTIIGLLSLADAVLILKSLFAYTLEATRAQRPMTKLSRRSSRIAHMAMSQVAKGLLPATVLSLMCF